MSTESNNSNLGSTRATLTGIDSSGLAIALSTGNTCATSKQGHASIGTNDSLAGQSSDASLSRQDNLSGTNSRNTLDRVYVDLSDGSRLHLTPPEVQDGPIPQPENAQGHDRFVDWTGLYNDDGTPVLRNLSKRPVSGTVAHRHAQSVHNRDLMRNMNKQARRRLLWGDSQTRKARRTRNRNRKSKRIQDVRHILDSGSTGTDLTLPAQ